MEKSTLIALAIIMATSGYAQNDSREFEMKEGDTTYTMKQYVMCLYLAGENRDQSEAEVKELQTAHMNHIGSLVETHQLQIAGPLSGNEEKRGVMIFDLPTVDEASNALSQDPAVKAGRLTYECYTWWAAKGSTLN